MIRSSSCPPWPPEPTSDPTEDRRSYTTPGDVTTVTRGTSEQVTFTSEPSGAAVQTSTGLHCAATPCTFDISRKSEFVATFSLAGYQDQQINVVTELAGNGAAGFAGNVLIGGVVGMGTDAVTGATQDHKPNPVHAVMVPGKAAPDRLAPAPKRHKKGPVGGETS